MKSIDFGLTVTQTKAGLGGGDRPLSIYFDSTEHDHDRSINLEFP